jgi:ADP-ribosylglycohydrolase
VNLGDDADTAGAVFGQLAGAFYGVEDIPGEWLDGLHQAGEIALVADGLASMTAAPILRTRFDEDK